MRTSGRLLAVIVVFLAGLVPPAADAKVSPLSLIARQIQKPNMLVVLDTSGSMNGVPGAAFTYSSEVGVDCDDGKNCRGWSGTSGTCSATGRSCENNADCQTRYCKVGQGTCTSDVDCPTQGTCTKGKYVCRSNADCAVHEVGKCNASGTSCSAVVTCAPHGKCFETENGCGNPGNSCKAGWCQGSKPRLFCTADKDCGASAKGDCAYGATPKGGCQSDSECATVKSCSTGESCVNNSDCPKITVGTCKYSKAACSTTADCKTGDVANDNYADTCQIPLNKCSGSSNYCDVAYIKCIYSAGNTCTEVANACKPDSNVCNIPVVNACLPPDLGDTCLKGSSTPGALKMCQIAQSLCTTAADCPAGDTCGNPTSRTVVAKRTLAKVIGQNYNILNLGLMTFAQSGYFPYYSVTDPVPTTETKFFTTLQLGACYTAALGPKATCTVSGLEYKLGTGNNSQYAVTVKGKTTTSDAAFCGDVCDISGVGTGLYQGSFYTRTTTSGTPTKTLKTFPTYSGQNMVSGGLPYQYLEVRPDYYNGAPSPPILGPDCSSNQCSATCGARWNAGLSTFINPSATEAALALGANKMLEWLAPAYDGGILTIGGTPSGCALENTGTKDKATSAYHYMKDLKQSDALLCRQNFVLFITDGEANGPGDTQCTNAACSAADPQQAGCTCQVVLSAWHLRKDLGVRTFVVGFSSDVAVGAPRIINDNVAKAGGTDHGNDGKAPYAFVATNETDLFTAINNAVYDAISGSYSTAPATASSGTQQSGSVKSGKYALDSRVDFPSWEGHLLAYDVTVNPPTLAWDANTELKKIDWRTRKLYVGTQDGNVVKVAIDKNNGKISNKDTLNALGLGSDPEEAERIIQFTLGSPESGNPAILGAFVNSTPIDVGQPGDSPLPGGHAFYVNNKKRPNLIYAGASDGLLHAFFGEETNSGGTVYTRGSEAFAFLPYSMFRVVTKVYAQGGQLADPNRHVFGLANSPKVKSLCVQNCADADQAVWKTLLVMNEGFGSAGMFVLDITNPLGEFGFSEPPIMPIWNSHDPSLAASYGTSVGETISVPGFYFNKTDAMNDHRIVFGSGYRVDPKSTTQGKRIVSASVGSGQITDAQTVAIGSSCDQDFGLLADVATAKNFTKGENGKLRAAYSGDTWGNLWRYDGSKISKVSSWGCEHPLHFAPTVVQLDRDDPANSAGSSYLVQVTNSALDNVTFGYPASKLIVRKEAKDVNGEATADIAFGVGGEMVLTVGTKELCAVTNGSGGCSAMLPKTARPTSTPLAILKRDGSGFMLMSMWYAQETTGCGKGTTWLAMHEISSQGITQIQGLKVADEPVTSPVVVGGKILIVGTNGTVDIGANIEASVSIGTSSPTSGLGGGVFRTLGWTELP